MTVRYLYTLPTAPAAECTLSYTVYPCGTVAVEMDYTPVEGLSPMPDFGVMLRMDLTMITCAGTAMALPKPMLTVATAQDWASGKAV